MAKNWQHRDVWTRQTQHFTVQVERREVEQADSAFEVLGPNRWNVYVYIYPTHPHFHKFDGPSWGQEAILEMPLHGGCTFLKYHKDALNGEVTGIQVGCDYNHDGDARYTHHATPADGIKQFRDADELFAWLERARISVEK